MYITSIWDTEKCCALRSVLLYVRMCVYPLDRCDLEAEGVVRAQQACGALDSPPKCCSMVPMKHLEAAAAGVKGVIRVSIGWRN